MSSKYIPFTQQPYCCVAACLQMVMYRHKIPLIPQEDLAYELGLTVPEEDAHLFAKVRTGTKPSSGWGTQIQDDKYEINKILKKLNIPLNVSYYGSDKIESADNLKEILAKIKMQNKDALLCFDYGKLWNLNSRGGHVCVFDRIDDDTVWLVDPERNVPKHRQVKVEELFKAINIHGNKNMCGIWEIGKVA